MWRKSICASGGGREMFLTSPYIDQAFTLRTPVVSVIGILRQLRRLLSGWRLGLLPVCRPLAPNRE